MGSRFLCCFPSCAVLLGFIIGAITGEQGLDPAVLEA